MVPADRCYTQTSPLDPGLLFRLASRVSADSNPAFSYPPARPIQAPADYDLYAEAHKHDVLLSYPYQSIRPFIRMLMKAGSDPDVVSIKMTLYRMASDSQIVQALINAAENGKEVTAMVELRARFDEQNNIDWSKQLEEAGCTVFYGFDDYKVHSKLTLITKKGPQGYSYITQIGTGNYNDSTAKIYTDLGLFTCNEQFGADASSLFNVITGYSRPPEYKHFIVAPHGMRSFFEYMIRQETENAKKGLPSGITVKVNSLVDPKIIELLYEASKAGVRVQLIVRGICCLIPGIEGVSENITVMSIVGQLLEHSRIFRFENAGNPRIYMGSADWMPRNLDRRVELVFPIEDETQKARAFGILDTMLSDTTNARFMQSDTSYEHVDLRGKKKISSQLTFYHEAQARLKELQSIEKDSVLIPIHSAEE